MSSHEETPQESDAIIDKTARQTQFQTWLHAPKPTPRNASETQQLAELIVQAAHDIMVTPEDANAEILAAFPMLATTPLSNENALAPDPRFAFLLALKRALNMPHSADSKATPLQVLQTRAAIREVEDELPPRPSSPTRSEQGILRDNLDNLRRRKERGAM